MFGVENSEGDEQVAEEHLDQGEEDGVKDADSGPAGQIECRQLLPGGDCPDAADGKLHDEIADADGGAAGAAASAQEKIAGEGDILPPVQAALAGAAMRARADNAFAGGPASQAHVEETAERQAE